jgi:predicted GIY-YIG superfamily endonuclease
MEFHYVYRLISKNHPDRHYTGLASNLKARLAKDNRGGSAAQFEIQTLAE